MEIVAAQPAARRELCVLSDRDVVAAVRAGDERAFERLYERYHRRIAAYVYGMVGDYGRAEDITQDVFISALRRIRETERPITLKPWLYEIAKNACIDQFRRSRRAEEVSYDADTTGTLEAVRVAPRGAEPDAVVDAKQQLDQLCGAFGGLSDVHHRILVMRELEGLSYREIGERLDLSRPAVESTLFRARRRLSEEYGELVSGERCLRVQSIIVTGAGSATGARDRRRLLGHVAHCRPCRRQAHLAGVDVAPAPVRSIRDAVVAKVAGFLPLPLLTRARRPQAADLAAAPAAHAPLSALAEPLAGWAKAVVAASLVVAGAGAGAVAPVAVRPALENAGATAPSRAAAGAPGAARTRHPALRAEPRRADVRRNPAAAPEAGADRTAPGAGSGGAEPADGPAVVVQRLVPGLDRAPVPPAVPLATEQAALAPEPSAPASAPAGLPQVDLAAGVASAVDPAGALGGS